MKWRVLVVIGAIHDKNIGMVEFGESCQGLYLMFEDGGSEGGVLDGIGVFDVVADGLEGEGSVAGHGCDVGCQYLVEEDYFEVGEG